MDGGRERSGRGTGGVEEGGGVDRTRLSLNLVTCRSWRNLSRGEVAWAGVSASHTLRSRTLPYSS